MMIRFLAVALIAVHTWAKFVCPPAQEIYPCECRVYPSKRVRCDDVSSLDVVQAALEGHFTENMPQLQLTNVHSFTLPARALGNLSPKRFILKDSNIRYIENDAFEGQASLDTLILANDRLEDIPTEALQKLTSLRSLTLAGNFLMRVQDQSLDTMEGLVNLVLYDNRISIIDRNAFPKSLSFLSISRNLVSTLNGSLQHLEHLDTLYASDNRLTNVRSEFDGLVRLQHLNLDRNHISDISDSFSNLTSIKVLSLSGNKIQDVGKDLMDLTQLKSLNLSHNYITELHWRIFEKLTDLEILDLSGNYLKNVCPILKPLRSLRNLGLSDLELSSLSPDCFHGMKDLVSLDLSHNRLLNTDAVSRHPLPSLLFLSLDHNQLRGLTYEMKYAKKLRILDISYNNFSSLKYHYLSHNKLLAILNIEGNPWKCTESTIWSLRDLEDRGIELKGRPDC